MNEVEKTNVRPVENTTSTTSPNPAPPNISTNQKSGGGMNKWLIGCGVVLILGFITFCCCIASLTFAGPSLLAGAFIDSEPLDIQVEQWSQSEIDALNNDVDAAIDEGGEVRISDEELTQLINNSIDDPDTKMRVDITPDDRVDMKLTTKADGATDQYINVSFVVEFEIENREFTKFIIHELKVGGINVGALWSGTDFSTEINPELRQTDNQDLQNVTDSFRSLRVEDGEFVIEFTPDARQNFELNQ